MIPLGVDITCPECDYSAGRATRKCPGCGYVPVGDMAREIRKRERGAV